MKFQTHWPLELPDWWLSQVRVGEPQDERGDMLPDSILGSLLDQCSDSLGCRALTGLIGGMDQLTRNSHRISYGPRALPQSGPTPTGKRGD